VVSFRPPPDVWAELCVIAEDQGRSVSDCLIEALHDLVKKKRRDKGTGPDG
jgi:hypothetical protein